MLQKPNPHKDGILPALILSTIAAMLATHLYTPSLPHLAVYFETTPAVVKLTMSFNVMAFGLMQLVYGPLSDRFGRRPVMLIGLSGFAVFSLACAASQSIYQLIAARIGQGLFSAAEAVLVYAIIHDLYRNGDRVRALAVYGMAIALGPAAAPVLGGYLQVYLGWRVIFFLIASVALAAVWLINRRLPESAPASAPPIRIWMIAADYGRLFINPGFMYYALLTGTGSGIIMAMVTAFPFILISNFGVATQRFGLFMCVPVLSFVAANFLVRKLSGRVAAERLLNGGLALAAAGALLLCVLGFSDVLRPMSLVLSMSLATFGLGPVFAVAPMKALDETDCPTGTASAVVNAVPVLMASLAALSLSVLHDGTSRPLALTLLGLLLVAGVCGGLAHGTKRKRQ